MRFSHSVVTSVDQSAPRRLNAHLSSIVSSKRPLSIHLPVEQIVRDGIGCGTCGVVIPRAESRLSSFGFSGTIAHGAYAVLGSAVRDAPFAASRYRGQVVDGVGLSPLLQTSVRVQTATRPGDMFPFLLMGWRFALGSSRLARLRMAGALAVLEDS